MIETVLAIETSCDDTSVAIVRKDGFVIGMKSQNQDQRHARFGGVVPEIASRGHAEVLTDLIDELLNETGILPNAVCATNRPGLLGSLIVGVVTAKTFAQYLKIPWLAVNHLEGHLFAPFLKTSLREPPDFEFPMIALAVSGGHTSLYRMESFSRIYLLGETRDDAAGEALDKFAKLLGLDFPGGAALDRLARTGDAQAFPFPRPLLDSPALEFSFSGLKAAGARRVEAMSPGEVTLGRNDLAASYQEAVVDVLRGKVLQALKKHPARSLCVTGGVSANARLRAQMEIIAAQNKITLLQPELRFCTDNAAMIGFAGIFRLNQGERSDWATGASPRLAPGDFLQ